MDQQVEGALEREVGLRFVPARGVQKRVGQRQLNRPGLLIQHLDPQLELTDLLLGLVAGGERIVGLLGQRGPHPLGGVLELKGERVERRAPAPLQLGQPLLGQLDRLLQLRPAPLNRRADLGEQRLLATLLEIGQHHLQHRLLKHLGAQHRQLAGAGLVHPAGAAVLAVAVLLLPLVLGAGVAVNSLTAQTAAERREQVRVEG
ncbi:MAG TPA: hypothetical protein PKD53_10065 [Chloroflexaceae bacterium]|nr:hypothetical protein [Chloroflexaceae bacterium]